MEITAGTKPVPRRTRTSLWRAVAIAAAVVVALAIVVYVAISAVVADDFSRPERHPITNSPADVGLTFEPVEFLSAVDNINLKGWYLSAPGSKAILMLHGRNGNRSDGPTALPIAQAFVKHGYNVLMFDFRAQGESAGVRYSFGSVLEERDTEGALKFLKGRGIAEIGVIGWSMGAATALNSAPDNPDMTAIVADSSFADAAMLAQAELPQVSGLPGIFVPGMIVMGRLMYGIDLNADLPDQAVTRLGDRPVLLIHGTKDDSVPVAHAYMLQKAGAGDPNLQLWIVPDACHTCAYKQNPAEYLNRVLPFFDKNLP